MRYKLITLIIAISTLILGIQLGLSRAEAEYSKLIESVSEATMYTDYIISSEDMYDGETTAGNCMPNAQFERLLDYAGLDY